jgi:hypothetical protein
MTRTNASAAKRFEDRQRDEAAKKRARRLEKVYAEFPELKLAWEFIEAFDDLCSLGQHHSLQGLGYRAGQVLAERAKGEGR